MPTEHTATPATPTNPGPQITRVPSESPLVDVLGGASRLEIGVHEHGFIALIDAMPRLVPEGQTADAAIVQAARVSYGAGTRKVSEDRGLIRYLLRHRHTTPFEMVEFKFHVAMPIFVARQWIRHRTANVNEYSGRYSIMPDRFYRPTPDNVRKQSATNRQGGADRFLPLPEGGGRGKGSPLPLPEGGGRGVGSQGPPAEGDLPGAHPSPPHSEFRTVEDFLSYLVAAESLYPTYASLTDRGVSRELARIALPQSVYTEWYWKCDLHNILRFLSLRMDAHAQEEIRLYAEAMYALLEPIVPITMQAWRDYEFDAVHLSRLEAEALRAHHRGQPPAPISDNKREQAEWEAKARKLGLP